MEINELTNTFLWSLIIVTWLAVGMHVVKEFVRFKWRRDE